MATPKLRDRDAIVTKEGMVFRVFGYSHPSTAYICDAEYAPARIFKSDYPKAFRNKGQNVFYKFYEDQGWKFVQNNYPQYMILHEMLQKRVTGVKQRVISEIRKPEERLKKLFHAKHSDSLISALRNVLDAALDQSGLSIESFGVFGSLLHGFYHPAFSDIDLVVYGGEQVAKLRKTLQELYESKHSLLRNEFETAKCTADKVWRFRNLTPKEFMWHQRRKLIYCLFDDPRGRRATKVEFEPAKEWKEIRNEYNPRYRILQRGWTKVLARVTEDSEAGFMPSVYHLELLKVLKGPEQAQQVTRIISYVEEFRMQAFRDENVCIEGNLEQVTEDSNEHGIFQIALTYCPGYYQQVLKTVRT